MASVGRHLECLAERGAHERGAHVTSPRATTQSVSLRTSNADIAAVLERTAEVLRAQGAGPFRVRAFQHAAAMVGGLRRPVVEILQEGGTDALERLPGIGESLASAIEEIAHSGRLRMLDRLEGFLAPEDVLRTVPGIGGELARRIHEELGVQTLEDLEVAAHDGRLAAVPGFGARRLLAVRESLESILRHAARRRARLARLRERLGTSRPPVAMLLDLDAEYRKLAAAGKLRTIAPRRFNPDRKAWLPVLHVDRDGWSMTALFSNTARAHELGKTHEWVVVFYDRDGLEDQCTVVTEHDGPLAGLRVVRGREAECAEHWRRTA
ncbi:MAG: DNA-binding protein [Deltaproteobacteria bacterium]|nr:DNA-binding protein [Deltaproteobacteria bacterium]